MAELPGAAKNLTTDFDYDVDGSIIGDQRTPRAGLPTPLVWSRDQRFVIVKAAERGRANLRRINAAVGTVEDLTTGDQDVLGYSASADASALAVVVSNPTMIGDLFLVDGGNGQMRPLYRPNQELVAELNLTPPEELTYTSFDGRKMQAWFQKPPDYVAGQRYPLILNIHGGPHAAYGYVFMHEFHWMAARGYVVLYPNPRGSSSYGQEFGNVIQYRYPGDDYKDLMAGVDELVKRGLVDPARLGVTGGSGGGVLTNWTVTRTDRFKAAVSQRSISDWANWWYTADFTQFQPEWFRGAPFEAPAEFAERSALTHVSKVKTPLMLVEGEADERTPAAAGGEPMFRALKYRKVPTVMVRFPGRDPRPLALGPALAPGRAAAAHRGLVRQIRPRAALDRIRPALTAMRRPTARTADDRDRPRSPPEAEHRPVVPAGRPRDRRDARCWVCGPSRPTSRPRG